jgi:transposase
MLLTSVTDYKSLYETEKKEKEELKNELLKMQLQLQKFAQMIFGSKSERFTENPAQLTLDIKAEEASPTCNLATATKVDGYVKANAGKKRDLSEFGKYLDSLPHVYETKEPDNKPEGAEQIGVDEHKSLEYTPGRLFVKVTLIPKYKVVSPNDKQEVKIIAAAAPSRPLSKCIAGASTLAQILVDKYADHLPVYRQKARFARDGTDLPYNTMLDWAGKAIDHLEILKNALRKCLLSSRYIHADETGLKVLCTAETKKYRKIHDGTLWCYNNSVERMVLFDYQHGRGVKYAEGILKDFAGHLQVDGWGVYKNLSERYKLIALLFCMAHARRKFKDALAYEPELASFALNKFQMLYEVERSCRENNLPYEEIINVRQQQSVPVLNELEQWMKQQYLALVPTSPLRDAIEYALRHWNGLCHYTTNGMLKIDNNPVENSIRPVALGRKNFLFAGSQRGAERIAIIYSLIGTCKMNGVNPYEWLKDVLERLNDYPVNKITDLLPHNWIRNQKK